jgi:flagellar hook-basal body complex protein FliE
MALTLPPILQPTAPADLGRAAPAGPARGAGSFADALGDAMSSVEKLQVASDKSAEEVAMGGGNLHEAALAMEKADVGMRLAVKVRNKLVDAYQEIMRMSV